MTTSTDAPSFDFEARYKVAGYGGIAWYATSYAKEWTEEEWIYCGEGDPNDRSSYLYNEPEEIEDRTRIVAIMVGDDREFTFDVDEFTAIGDLDYCHVCGQIGCTHDGLDREE